MKYEEMIARIKDEFEAKGFKIEILEMGRLTHIRVLKKCKNYTFTIFRKEDGNAYGVLPVEIVFKNNEEFKKTIELACELL